jgi:DNA polymerase III subunit beta
MRITCPTKHLKEVLALTSRGIKKNSPIPALECVRVATGEIGIEMTATDYEMEVRCAMGCHVEEPGEVILPAKRFLEVIGAFSGSELCLKTENGIAHLKCGRSNFRLAAYPSEMPVLPETDDTVGVILPQALLRDMLVKVQYAMGNDANRPGLNGAQFSLFSGGRLEMAATDTHQLAVYPVKLEGDDLPEFACTIPRRMVSELQNFLTRDEDEDVEVVIDAVQIEFRTPYYTIKSRLQEGRAPSYAGVVPREPVAAITLDRAAFLDTVKRLDILAKEDMHRFRLELTGSAALFWTQAAGVGDADEQLTCESSHPDELLVIWLHARQVAGILDTFEGNKVTLHYSGERRPLIFAPEVGAYYTVLMPMVAANDTPSS